MSQLSPQLTEALIALAVEAGEAIMEVYARTGDVAVTVKADDSPLTEADRAAHHVIAAGLERLTPEIPVLSEEGREIPTETRRGWETLWVLDPLDGTKEFIKRNGEFTVNSALVSKGRTVWGVVHAPDVGVTYWGGQETGAFRKEGDGAATSMVGRPIPEAGLTVVMSRSHPSSSRPGTSMPVRISKSD